MDKLANRFEQCLYVGHSEEIVNTFLLYHREEGQFTEGSISKFDENIDEYGKLLSTFDSTYFRSFEVKSERLKPYLDFEQYYLQFKYIYDADVYDHAEDNETCIVLRIMTLDNTPQTGICIRASSMFKIICKGQANMRIQKQNVDMFSQWFTNNKKKTESMHPILKEVWCQ